MNLESLRKVKNWSQKKLERESGISQGYISTLERGIKQPTLPVLKKLAVALGVSITELLDDQPAAGAGRARRQRGR